MSHPKRAPKFPQISITKHSNGRSIHKSAHFPAELFSVEFGDIAPASVVADMQRDFARQLVRIEAAVAQAHLPRRERTFIARLTTRSGVRGFLPMCHVPARTASSRALMNALVDFSLRRRSVDPDFRIYLGTFCFDDGVTLQRSPVIRLKRIKRKIDKGMRAFGLSGVYHVELEYMLAPFRTRGTRVNVHVHTACWVAEGKFHPTRRAEEMMATSRFPNPLGAPSVDFRCKLDQTPSQIAGLAKYISKWQLCVKQLRYRLNGKPYLDEYVAKYSYLKTWRMVEMLSRISIYDAVGGVGEGKTVRKAWKTGLKRWEHAQHGSFYQLDTKEVALGWRRVARTYRKLQRFTRVS